MHNFTKRSATKTALYIARNLSRKIENDQNHPLRYLLNGLPINRKHRQFFLFIRIWEVIHISGAIDPQEVFNYFYPQLRIEN
jgi:hypothetical protein